MEITKEAAEHLWTSYLGAYGNVSPEERRRLLRQSVSDVVVSSNPTDEVRGMDDLVAHVDQFQQRLPGAYFRSNQLFFHHNQILSEWPLYNSDAPPLRTAHTYARLDDGGRLVQLTGFF